ncbi:DNA replication domain protein [Klebsiella huaxiensis]|uniref:DNA replication domain protein n=1 Tax=Klebsiella huaxiensis TaxID=2153354 RepID=UPI003CCC1CE4
MANQWLRLWHDMPNDPKWRTIARISGQPIALVQAVYIHLLVSGSQNVTRGHADVTNEDLASHFDVTECDIDAVINAMQGRVLDGTYLTGWERRQPKKEDRGNDETGAKSATQRKREQRERQRRQQQERNESRQCHDESRHVTTDKEEIKIREDLKDKTPPNPPRGREPKKSYPYPEQLNAEAWEEWKAYRSEMRFKSYAPTERSEGAAITELINLSGGNHVRQMQIVKQSMAKGWKGLFELKGGTERRDVNAISEPDTHIPPGFRGGPTH